MRSNEGLVLALPKGRILKEVIPVLRRAGIEIERAFDDDESRQLRFATSIPGLDVIRVRNFDVATFVAFGAAHIGVAGNDVLMEFDYPEIYAPLDLDLGHCRLAVAGPADLVAKDEPTRWSHVRVATKYPEITRRFFAARGVQADCIKLNGAMELAPTLGLCRRIVDLVQTGSTLKANGLVEIEKIADVSSRLVVNRATLKTRAAEMGAWIERFGEPYSMLPEAVRRLNAEDADFASRFSDLADSVREIAEEVDAVVAGIIADVRRRGDAALVDQTRRLDRHKVTPETLAITAGEIDRAVAQCDPKTLAALRVAADRIRAYHVRQRPQDADWTDETGVRLGWRWTALQSVGIYVPGGTAAYPSSVMMNAVPAKVAGVDRVVMVVPTPDGILNPLVLAAARLAGVDEIYRVGGAQAVAALAYGTETMAPVVKVVGPGNAYVTAAKRQVFGKVGIDMMAGPSEILVVADAQNEPRWIAADLLSQAEHDALSQSILITDDPAFADAVAEAVETCLATLPRRAIAEESWRRFGAIIVVRSLDDAPALVDRLAPEHIELAVAEPDALARRIRNAGAMFLGRMTPEAIGDYVGGSNHVLPTSRAARFASGLGVQDFVKRTSILSCDAGGLAAIGGAAMALAEAEGLHAHALSIRVRLET